MYVCVIIITIRGQPYISLVTWAWIVYDANNNRNDKNNNNMIILYMWLWVYHDGDNDDNNINVGEDYMNYYQI